jgi:hypothetical protein
MRKQNENMNSDAGLPMAWFERNGEGRRET